MALMTRESVSRIRNHLREPFHARAELARLGAHIKLDGDTGRGQRGQAFFAARQWRPICAPLFRSLSLPCGGVETIGTVYHLTAASSGSKNLRAADIVRLAS
jgi:hypothetical protein